MRTNGRCGPTGSSSVRGATALDKIDLSKLRVKGKSKRARNARPKLEIDKLKAVFATPPFNNCAGWDRLTEPSIENVPVIFHCALYFVPILIYYTGCRREELCGLMVDDVIVDNGNIPYLHIAKNARRRIKNDQSQRNIPLHPEVLRLNFLQYLRAIKALGYGLLFPDLFSPSSRSPLGDRFYKEFKPILQAAGVNEKGLGAHAVRHLFGAQLKKRMVTEEERADLLGHGGESETSERYCEPHEVATLMQFVMKLPVITADLEPQDIHLLPWVAERQVAPFSQPSRSKSAGATILSRERHLQDAVILDVSQVTQASSESCSVRLIADEARVCAPLLYAAHSDHRAVEAPKYDGDSSQQTVNPRLGKTEGKNP